MPYNPGVTSTSGESLARGIEAGKSHLIEALQWAFGEADKTKELRGALDTIDPAGKDAHKQMSKPELQGKLLGLQQKDKMQQDSLSLALGQQSLAAGQRQAGAETAMTSAMQQALPPVRQSTVDLQGNPAQAGNPFTVNAASRGQMTPNALMQAISQNPQAINSPAGRQAMNDWMRFNSQRGGPQFMTGPDGSTWAYSAATGQFEPSPLDKINATFQAKAKAAGPPPPGPEQPPQTSKDGKFYYDYHLKTWKPITNKGTDLFGGAGGDAASAGGVTYQWKNGQLIRGE